MLIKKIKKILYLMIILVSMFLVFKNIYIKKTLAFRRNETMFHMMNEMDTREVVIYNNVFYVYTNQEEKSLLVTGIVTDWKELGKVEEYFILRSPSTYHLIFDIDFK